MTNGKRKAAVVGVATAKMSKQMPMTVRDVAHRLIREAIEDAGIENIHFAWDGSVNKGEPHHYVVQGPTFLIEYDNTQDDANHVHCIWRDFDNDFGYDMLRRHYALHHEK